MKNKWIIFSICLAAFTLSAQIIAEQKEPLEITSLVKKTSFCRYPLPSFKVPEGGRLVLSFDAYLKSPAPAGWGGYLELRFHAKNAKKRL